jgi:hypothetical protein
VTRFWSSGKSADDSVVSGPRNFFTKWPSSDRSPGLRVDAHHGVLGLVGRRAELVPLQRVALGAVVLGASELAT